MDRDLARQFVQLPWRFRLYETPLYTLSEAASILDIAGPQLKSWIRTWQRHPGELPPLYSALEWQDKEVTWFDLAQSQFVIDTGIATQVAEQLRFLRKLREQYEEHFVVLTKNFWKPSNRERVYNLQVATQLSPSCQLIKSNSKLALSAGAERFTQRLKFDRDGLTEEMILIPADLKGDAPIEVSPGRASGMPIMRNISIEYICDSFNLGGVEEVQDFYEGLGFTESEIWQTVRYNNTHQLAA